MENVDVDNNFDNCATKTKNKHTIAACHDNDVTACKDMH